MAPADFNVDASDDEVERAVVAILDGDDLAAAGELAAFLRDLSAQPTLYGTSTVRPGTPGEDRSGRATTLGRTGVVVAWWVDFVNETVFVVGVHKEQR